MKRARGPEDGDENAAGYSQDVAIVPSLKIISLDTDNPYSRHPTNTALQCSLPGHARGMSFASYAEYERHYAQVHSNRCLECIKNFPTSYILSLHIQEHHDTLTELKREKGEPTYVCFVEVCEDKFPSFGEREQHLIQEHAYPQNYFFAVTKFGINAKRQSMLVEHDREHNSQHKELRSRIRKSNRYAANPAAQRGDTTESNDEPMTDTEGPVMGREEPARNMSMSEEPRMAEETAATKDVAMAGVSKPAVAKLAEEQKQQGLVDMDTDMECLVGAMSSLKFVPRVIRLGSKPRSRR